MFPLNKPHSKHLYTSVTTGDSLRSKPNQTRLTKDPITGHTQALGTSSDSSSQSHLSKSSSKFSEPKRNHSRRPRAVRRHTLSRTELRVGWMRSTHLFLAGRERVFFIYFFFGERRRAGTWATPVATNARGILLGITLLVVDGEESTTTGRDNFFSVRGAR